MGVHTSHRSSDKQRGFTLVEVLVASGISVGIFAAVSLFMTFFSATMPDAGAVEIRNQATGTSAYAAIAPNDTAFAIAQSIAVALQTDASTGGFVMAVDGVIERGWPGTAGDATAIAVAPPSAFISTTAFKAQLLAPAHFRGYAITDASVPFAAGTGYSFVVLDPLMIVRSVTRVSWSDLTSGDNVPYRIYEISRTPLTGTPQYCWFLERASALQDEPGFTFAYSNGVGEITVRLPDPSLNLFGVYSRLESQSTDSTALAAAKAAVPKTSTLSIHAFQLP